MILTFKIDVGTDQPGELTNASQAEGRTLAKGLHTFYKEACEPNGWKVTEILAGSQNITKELVKTANLPVEAIA